ncbi:MAG: hypothetical protein ACREXP_21375, partial [Steroidobacteraceae bacterium]
MDRYGGGFTDDDALLLSGLDEGAPGRADGLDTSLLAGLEDEEPQTRPMIPLIQASHAEQPPPATAQPVAPVEATPEVARAGPNAPATRPGTARISGFAANAGLDPIVEPVPAAADGPSFGQTMSAVPVAIGARIESKITGTKEYFGSSDVADARKKLWQALVLPQAVRAARDQGIALTEYPDVVDNAKRLGIRPDTFTRDWPSLVNESPEKIAAIVREQQQRIAEGSARRDEGAARRTMAAQVAAENRPAVADWSLNGLAFDAATSIPDLLIGAAGTVATGGAGGIAAMMVTLAPEYYADGKNQGLDVQKAATYGALMTLSEAVPELPVVEVLARTPGGKKLIRQVVGERLADSAAGHVVGTAAIEGVSESVTEALQVGIDSGLLDERTSLPAALERIARAGVIGSAVGGAAGTIPATAHALERAQHRSSDFSAPIRGATGASGPIESPAAAPTINPVREAFASALGRSALEELSRSGRPLEAARLARLDKL